MIISRHVDAAMVYDDVRWAQRTVACRCDAGQAAVLDVHGPMVGVDVEHHPPGPEPGMGDEFRVVGPIEQSVQNVERRFPHGRTVAGQSPR